MSENVITIKEIYLQLVNISRHLERIENLLIELVLEGVPEIDLDSETITEVEKSVGEMKLDKHVKLGDLKK